MVKIIVEGPDNSGKSTLVSYLQSVLQVPIVPGEGPARSEREINSRVTRYNEVKGPAIFDRHPCISQPIYNEFRQPIPVDQALIEDFYGQRPFIIYCRGRDTLDGHQVKECDSLVDANGQRHEDLVNRFHSNICILYDRWAENHANLIYRIGDNMSRLAGMLKSMMDDFDPVRDIAEFHHKFGLEYTGPARTLPRELADFRKRFMDEELDEYGRHEAQAYLERYVTAREARDPANYTYHLEQMLDALVDEVYVVLGTAYLHGFPFKEAWRRVHRANMQKVRAVRASDSKRGSAYDVVKPPHWSPPDHSDLVEINDAMD